MVSGAGLSVALSVLFYILVLAADAKFDSGPSVASKTAGVVQMVNNAVTDNSTLPVAGAQASAQDDASARVLLARAHDCASAGRWDCVFDATTSAIALRGETLETDALLAEAMKASSWQSPQRRPGTRAVSMQGARLESTASSRPARKTTHMHAHARHDRKVKYASAARPASFADMATLYHQ